MNVTLLAALVTQSTSVYYVVLLETSIALAWFMVRAL